MHDAAAATTDQTAAPDPQVHIHRKTFERIEGLRTRVAETTIALDRASREHKEAKSAHETAQSNLSVAVSDMLDEVNGISKLPLFDNQTDAIAKAEADPVAQKLLARMLDHEITHLNVLVVAGYSEDQRAELAAYLDALDAWKAAEAEGQSELLEPPTPPAFLAETSEPPMTEEQADAFSCQLQEEGIEIATRVLLRMTLEQRQDVAKWLNDTRQVKAEKGEALTVEDLPPAPSYILNPAELTAAGDVLDEAKPPAAEPKTTARTARRSSSKFQNRPRVVKGTRARKAH
jgi:hypothetical protein